MAWLLFVLVATWCLVAVGVALLVCRAIRWAAAAETTIDPVVTLPAVALPSPRSADVSLDLNVLERPAAVAAGNPGALGRNVEPQV